ncbi:MAG: thioredoxin family protein, partial [Myxococcales bacterium]|nr:thioredoxin family protein [Myxococcales bacterium]
MRCAALLTLALLAVPAAARAADGPLPWHHDDYDTAVKAARASGRPIVVDLWAPWCHTCLSMQQTVLRDPAVVAQAHRFIWLALDTDRPGNADAVARLPAQVWPTFYVVAADGQTIEARQLGSTSVEGFVAFLTRGAAGAQATGRGAQRRAADRAAAAGDAATAAEIYRTLLATTAGDPELQLAQIGALYEAGKKAECVAAGRDGLPHIGLGHTPAAADFIYYLDACLQGTPDVAPAEARALRVKALTVLDAVLADEQAPLAVDDRSEALRVARELHDALGQPKEARARAEAQQKLLADAATTPQAQMAYGWPRVEVAVYLRRLDPLRTELAATVAALPEDYDPPYRLAWLLHQFGRNREAAPLAEQARRLVYGPRKARVLGLLADIHAAH